MRLPLKLVTVVSFAFVSSVFAADDGSASHNHGDAAKATAADHMKEMESQMNAMMEEKDPAKKHELMEKHMHAMHEHMQAMKDNDAGKEQGMAKRMKTIEERMEKMEKEMHGMMGKPATDKKADEKPAEHKH